MRRLCLSLMFVLLLLAGGCSSSACGTVQQVYTTPELGPVAVVVQLDGREQCFLWTDETALAPGSSLSEGQLVVVHYTGRARSWNAPDGEVFSARNLKSVSVVAQPQ